MELLTDILTQAGVRHRLLHRHTLPPHVALQFPCERSIGFHVVTSGQAFVHPMGASAPLALNPGDVALMARGCSHVVSAGARFDGNSVHLMTADPPAPAADAEDAALLVSGAYQLWNTPVHPFFHDLPDWVVLAGTPAEAGPQLADAIGLLDAEIRNPGLGSQRIIDALLDVIFTCVLRRVLQVRGAAPGTWSHGIGESRIRRAVEQMHANYARDWTLADLAREAGLSRAGLAEKFRHAMGCTPGDYLRKVRMQRAMRLLSESSDGLEAVAAAVGYRDAFGFSKVFKRTVGLSPREFRRQDRADRALAIRF